MTVESYIVRPTNKYNGLSPPLIIQLHSLYLFGAPIDMHNHRFYYYDTVDIICIIDKLKSSLAKALKLYSPVMGTSSCGTIAIVTSINHQVTDLTGYLYFLKVPSKGDISVAQPPPSLTPPFKFLSYLPPFQDGSLLKMIWERMESDFSPAVYKSGFFSLQTEIIAMAADGQERFLAQKKISNGQCFE
ncbi:uncharacterized protein BX663DRAFT_549754 [Cokeromyces recurvatus]|uniref:uncharacterized protein n=1 Tax=Cokeromyces recurvatus TaxID=90255 RepID=UPI00221EE192|nr:uncharacterized protein BX663DRAFT_549754 [Cokeromyces recurvatus]KAI7905791.1 hypothetical protein BX663DRAFT_549754 [Cokeromyces recurvatus]